MKTLRQLLNNNVVPFFYNPLRKNRVEKVNKRQKNNYCTLQQVCLWSSAKAITLCLEKHKRVNVKL